MPNHASGSCASLPCWPEHSVVTCECRASSRMTGANLIASGRVPTTQRNRMGPPAKVSLDQDRPLISSRCAARSRRFSRQLAPARRPSPAVPEKGCRRSGVSFIAEQGQPLQGAHAIAVDCRIEPRLIRRQLRTVVLHVPQMQHASREPAVLAPDACMLETHHEIGILAAPAGISRIEAVDAVEILTGHCQIAGLYAPPAAWKLAQRPEREAQRRQQA